MRRSLATIALLAIVASACQGEVAKSGSDGADHGLTTSPTIVGPTDLGAPGEADGSGPAFAPDQPDQGTRRADPLSVQQATRIGDWDVRIVAYDADATDEVLAFNGQNKPPKDGQVFAVARLEATWRGTGSKNAFLSLEWALVDDEGRAWTDDGCGVLPDDLASQSEVPAGSTANGTVCFVVDRTVLDDVVLYVAPLLGDAGTRRWWPAPKRGVDIVFEPTPTASASATP